jgi:hypothetical protein
MTDYSIFMHSTCGTVGVYLDRVGIFPEQIQQARDDWKKGPNWAFQNLVPGDKYMIYNWSVIPLFNHFGFTLTSLSLGTESG